MLVTAEPEAAGLASDRLARIDAHLERNYVAPGKIAGALTVVHRRGETVYASPVGMMDRERGRPVELDTIFRIYSMSKPITSVALMMLYEHGLFRLDDPVHRFIPEWRNLRVFEAGNEPRFMTRRPDRPMSIRDLLRHTSGLTYGFMERTNVDAAYRKRNIGSLGKPFDGTLRDLTDALAEVPLEFSPGTAWNYSVATDVCGALVERIADQPYDAYLQEKIFGPLGMLDTGFHVPADKAARLAAGYTRFPDKSTRLTDDPETSHYLTPPRLLSGGGGLVSTAHDYLRFCRMLLAGGALDSARILGPRTLALMTRNHLPGGATLAEFSTGLFSEVAFAGTGFGLGFSVNLDPVEAGVIGSAGEFAWGGAMSTIFWVDPAEDLTVVFLTQLHPSQAFDFRGQLKTIVYGAITD